MKISRSSPLGHIGYFMAAILIVATAWTLHDSVLKAQNSILAVEHTLQVHQELVQLSEGMFRLASAQRGYLLSGDGAFIAERRGLQDDVEKVLIRLARLSVEDPRLAARVNRLEGLIAYRMAAMRAVHIPKGAPNAGLAIADSVAMAALDDEIEVAEKEELSKLGAHRTEQQLMLEGSSNLLALTLLACLVIMVPGYVGFVIQGRARTRAQHELVRLKELAETSTRAKSTFLATVSHEIRTPMNGVLGMLEVLSLTRLDPEQRTTLEVVRESSKSLLRIIDDILDFSKIEAGKLNIVLEAASVDAIVASVATIYSGNASSKGLTIRRFVDPAISPAVFVDPVRLQQILRNYVMNAIKFTSRGHIEIRAELLERRPDGDLVRFSVKDTGVGISLADQSRLFQPFAQAIDGANRQADGTGLGLSICKRLAVLMGGTVDIASVPGSGTTLFVTLPLKVADAAVLAQRADSRKEKVQVHRECRAAPSIAQAEAEGTLVLLVDDHPINRLVLTKQVNSLGYACEVADDGVQALARWKSRHFGLVLTDCNMPEMDGFGLARSIREAELEAGNRRVPIIACTANAMEGEAGKCFAAGMDDYLAKPIDLAGLQKKLDRWLPIAHEFESTPKFAIV